MLTKVRESLSGVERALEAGKEVIGNTVLWELAVVSFGINMMDESMIKKSIKRLKLSGKMNYYNKRRLRTLIPRVRSA